MKQKVYLYLLLILCLLLVSVFQGCSAKPTISQNQTINQDDLKAVNDYITECGADDISLQNAEDINKLELYESKETHEIKTIWQLVVDYVRNTKNGDIASLGYSIVFEDSGFSLEDNDKWEYIGS